MDNESLNPVPAAAPVQVEVVKQDTEVKSDVSIHEQVDVAPVAFSQVGEFTEGPVKDEMVEVYRQPGLSSPNVSLDIVADEVKNLMSSLTRDEEGNIQFASNEQREKYEMFQNMMSCIAPQYNVSDMVPYAMGESVSNCDPESFISGVKRTNDVFTVAKSTKTASAVLERIRNKRNSGHTITLYLPVTGIYVSFTAPSELDYCNYEVELAMQTSNIGYNSYGLMLSTTSGAYLQSMIDFSLRFAVSTTLDIGDMSIAQALRYHVKSPDYGILLLGPMIAKFPGGIPWDLINPVSNTVDHVAMNIHRIIRTLNDRLTDTQREFFTKHTKPYTVTADMLKEYEKASRQNNKERYVDKELGLAFYFKQCTLDEYFESVDEWIKGVEFITAKALGQYPTENERAMHTATVIEAHRLTRYQHKIAAVATVDENGDDEEIVDDQKEIRTFLTELSSDRAFVKRFEEAVAGFEEECRRTAYGYMPRGETPEALASTTMRGFIPLSPDKLFFTVSRVVYELQRVITQAYANVG